MKISVSGNSGCELHISQTEGRYSVTKVARDQAYVDRLKAQITKQRNAYETVSLPFVHIPKVLDEMEIEEQGQVAYAAVMEYLNYQDYAEFFLKSSLKKIDNFINNAIQIIEMELEAAVIETVDPNIFYKKLDEIDLKIKGSAKEALKRQQLERIRAELQHAPVNLPLAPIHGDLTLANMMISADGSKIGIFDFLDSYLDSPLLDIAKLRQDTQFHWSELMTSEPIDHARYLMVMEYIDRQLDQYFHRYDWYTKHYGLIQAINIARIFPYEKHEKVTEFTTSTLTRLGY